jgi:hypothetical protein
MEGAGAGGGFFNGSVAGLFEVAFHPFFVDSQLFSSFSVTSHICVNRRGTNGHTISFCQRILWYQKIP